MTDKKQSILKAALALFAETGYHATSTKKVATKAGVSEGLIFRHFVNKEGLLNAIMKQGEERAKGLFANIVMETNPNLVIRKTIELPFSIVKADYEFWYLQFRLKWELKQYNNENVIPLSRALTHAFRVLGYETPELEAEFLVHYIEGISAAILKNHINDNNAMKDFLLAKYSV